MAAKTELLIKAKADTKEAQAGLRGLNNTVEQLQQKNRESLKAIVGLAAPFGIVAKAASEAFQAAWSAGKEFLGNYFGGWRETFAKMGDDTNTLADKLKASSLEAARLKAAADAAGVSANEYNRAIERIASGRSTLEREAAAWEQIARSAGKANEIAENRRHQLVALVQAERREREEAAKLSEELGAEKGGMGEALEYFDNQIRSGKRNASRPITREEFERVASENSPRAWYKLWLGRQGRDEKDVDAAVRLLNNTMQARTLAYQHNAIDEANAAKERAAAYEKEKKEREAAQNAANESTIARYASWGKDWATRRGTTDKDEVLQAMRVHFGELEKYDPLLLARGRDRALGITHDEQLRNASEQRAAEQRQAEERKLAQEIGKLYGNDTEGGVAALSRALGRAVQPSEYLALATPEETPLEREKRLKQEADARAAADQKARDEQQAADKKRDEEERKAREEETKTLEGMALDFAKPLEQAFAQGGGRLAGLQYVMPNEQQTDARQLRSLLKKLNRAELSALERIRAALEE